MNHVKVDTDFFYCRYCDFRSTYETTFHRHEMSHQKHFDKAHKCQHCHKGFSLETALKKHYSRQHPNIVKEDLFCEKCGVLYKQKCKKCKPKSKCNDCGKELSRKSLKRHKLTCKGLKLNCSGDLMETEPENEEEKTVNNDDDTGSEKEEETTVNNDDDDDTRSEKEEEKPVNNDDDIGSEKGEEEIEVDGEIEEINVLLSKDKFQCEECDKTFVFESKFKRHIKSHRIQVGKKCPVCKKYFKNSNSLSTHINKFHMI